MNFTGAQRAAQHQPAGAPQRRDQAPYRRGRHLPERSRRHALVGALLLEQNDEWSVQRRYMTLETLGTVSDAAPGSLPAVAA